MIQLVDNDSRAPIGSITDEELMYLQEHLEEESADDQDYWIDGATLDALEEDGAQPRLIELLRKALGEREGMEVRWSKM
jgi:hypothetical protein